MKWCGSLRTNIAICRQYIKRQTDVQTELPLYQHQNVERIHLSMQMMTFGVT